jgi:hypothetical protein
MSKMTFKEWMRIQQLYYHITDNSFGEFCLSLVALLPYWYFRYRKECKI